MDEGHRRDGGAPSRMAPYPYGALPVRRRSWRLWFLRRRSLARGLNLGPMAPDLDALLHAAVQGVGGTERPGQVTMAKAVEAAIEADEHLLVQAGTGTGKSLAYLIPAVAHAVDDRQAGRRRHRHAGAAGPDRRPRHAAAGRGARAAARPPADLRAGQGPAQLPVPHKLEGGFPDDEDGLFVGRRRSTGSRRSRLGAEVVRLREWADETESGDRDELVPGVSERAWRQVSVSAHECLGGKCPMVAECFVERAREAAKDVDVVVTNHSLHGDRLLRGPPDAARARRARRRRGARAGRPGHLDDHRRADRPDGRERRPSGPAGWPSDRAGRRRRRSCSQGVLDEAPRGPAARHPRLARRSPSRGCATPPARCRPSSSRARRRGRRRRPAGGPGRGRRDLRERRADPRGARARRRVGQPRPAARVRCCAWRR